MASVGQSSRNSSTTGVAFELLFKFVLPCSLFHPNSSDLIRRINYPNDPVSLSQSTPR
ncbi:1193_t:CDS:1, partial [Acaulospora colombiana]